MVVVVVVVVKSGEDEVGRVDFINLALRVFRSFHTHLTSKTNLHLRQGLSVNKIGKVGDYSCNFRKLGTKGEKWTNHRDYPDIFLFKIKKMPG
ncbi:hypothetical protein Hanom_Chr14g01289521 [Helianthus anomalus]